MSYWVEEYGCGCVSDSPTKKRLLGYCAKHGDSRRNLFKEEGNIMMPVKHDAPGMEGAAR